MSKKEKLIKRLLSKPNDFTFDELLSLLEILDFKFSNSGKTSGSACKFKHENGGFIFLHKPHPKPILKSYQVSEIVKILKEMNLI